MIEYFIQLLERLSEHLPLPIFTFVGAFVEELIAPIPSPFVMTLAGSFVRSQGQHMSYLVLLAITGMIGKTIGCFLIYQISMRFEHVITHRFGKYVGLTQGQIDKISKRLQNSGRQNLTIFILRAAPIIPTAPVSIVAGLLQLEQRGYLIASAAGVFVRNVFYLYLGYTSVNALENINNNLNSVETIGYVIVLAGVAGIILYIYKKRREF